MSMVRWPLRILITPIMSPPFSSMHLWLGMRLENAAAEAVSGADPFQQTEATSNSPSARISIQPMKSREDLGGGWVTPESLRLSHATAKLSMHPASELARDVLTPHSRNFISSPPEPSESHYAGGCCLAPERRSDTPRMVVQPPSPTLI